MTHSFGRAGADIGALSADDSLFVLSSDASWVACIDCIYCANTAAGGVATIRSLFVLVQNLRT